MRERVSVIQGKLPVIFVAPHGADDINTAELADEAANELGCYAVINRGFERSDVVDVEKDQANCNRCDHCKEDVVFDEFLKPILKIKDRLIQRWHSAQPWYANNPADPCACLILHIHGCGNLVHKTAGEDVGIIVGYGLGAKKDSLSCEVWRKNAFIDLFRQYYPNGDAFEGKSGGKYAGRDTNNMNQYFRKWLVEPLVDSMQLEIPYNIRASRASVSVMATTLAVVVSDLLKFSSYAKEPKAKFI